MKTVLISGASRGLGRELAKYLVSSGYKVFTFARSEPVDGFSNNNLIHYSNVDALSPMDSKQLTSILPEIDVLVNNVGVAFDGLLATQGVESIEDVIATNLTSVLKLTKEFLRCRLKSKLNGTIVNVSSIIGIRGYAGLAAYSASKAGLDGMTRSIAREMGPKGFRINSVLPGYFDSSMSSGLSEAQRNQIIRRTPLGRLPETADVVPVIEFLISDSSNMITGQSIVVDGGITV